MSIKRLNDFDLAQRLENYIKARRDDPAAGRLIDPAADPRFHLVRKELIERSDGGMIFDDLALLESMRTFMLRTLTTTNGLEILCEILVELQVRGSEEIARAKAAAA